VAYLPPTSTYPDGLIISGGKNTIIEVRQPGKAPEDNAEALLLGHSHNVCVLDIDSAGNFIISGGWDGQARIWTVGRWNCDAILEGHEGSVWAVLAYDAETVITGCADQLIRVFHTSGKLLKTIKGTNDVVRALCRVPKGHPSGADFASAGNDGIIRFWTVGGRQVGQLQGHESFIYSLAALPTGEIASSGEDRTVRIWKGDQCVQTITFPAISVWSVAVCAENGDLVAGASDRIVRVFTRDPERIASAESIRLFEESVKTSSIPQQQLPEINKEKLPGPDFLQRKAGTKEGQVQMITEHDGSVTAHQWSVSQQQWISIGTVVDAVGSSGKKVDYLGKEYDYVFDVDIEDGKPPLKLPYNLSQNPYEAATKFIQDNELPITYLDTVANFITTNTQGATLGASQNQGPPPPGHDPWGTEARYRPGSGTDSAPAAAPVAPKILPQKTYLSILVARYDSRSSEYLLKTNLTPPQACKRKSKSSTKLSSKKAIKTFPLTPPNC
jgi:phospholipase A-2-activating protein